jgi:hypothetical protein
MDSRKVLSQNGDKTPLMWWRIRTALHWPWAQKSRWSTGPARGTLKYGHRLTHWKPSYLFQKSSLNGCLLTISKNSLNRRSSSATTSNNEQETRSPQKETAPGLGSGAALKTPDQGLGAEEIGHLY